MKILWLEANDEKLTFKLTSFYNLHTIEKCYLYLLVTLIEFIIILEL
jgi:hypothetical protein